MVPHGSSVVMVTASSSGYDTYTLSYHLLDERDDLMNLLESNNGRVVVRCYSHPHTYM